MASDPLKGPIILWIDHGYDGWDPRSFDTVTDALLADKYGSKHIITRRVEFEINETTKEEK